MCDSPILAEQISAGEPLKIYGELYYFLDLYNKECLRNWILLPCGKCVSCRMAFARAWAVRCAYELQGCEHSCFVTLTYNDRDLPVDGSLFKEDYQKFLKRLRKKFHDIGMRRIGRRSYVLCPHMSSLRLRYFGCGEYGSKSFRPHYHFILFGWCPNDLEFFFYRDGYPVYRSKFLEKLWPHGFVTVGTVTEDSIKYVTRYTLKKIEQDLPSWLVPSFTCCSQKPAIGLQFFQKNWHDAFANDENGAIVRYGFPDPFNPGSFLDIRYFRNKLFENPEMKSNLKSFFGGVFKHIDFDELDRRESFSAVRLAHNTHYGRLVDMSDMQHEEKKNASSLCNL